MEPTHQQGPQCIVDQAIPIRPYQPCPDGTKPKLVSHPRLHLADTKPRFLVEQGANPRHTKGGLKDPTTF